MITPLEIENKKFSKKNFNGYNPEEVDDFLDELVRDYEVLYRKATESQDQIEDLSEKIEHYNNIQETLQSTLIMAQTAAEEVKAAAQKQAEQIIKRAENQAKEATMGIDQDLKLKKKELEKIKKEFDVYKAKMESLLISQLELLKEVNKDD
ncbi:MAG: DivIVA domain-containing protein [Clostridia bacterium]|nr:DivIVA domain-containing protein [Clostridia bacterium]